MCRNALFPSVTERVNNTRPNCNLIVVFTSNTRLRKGFSFKDRIPEVLRSHLIYKFQCGNCNISYVGKTYRHFQVRYSEHLGISKLTNKQLYYRENLATAVRKHIIDDKHDDSPESFKIIGYAKSEFHLLIKESLIIQNRKPFLNKTVKSFPLYLF